jgi:multiple sugar transport system substrate-binding protein
MKKFTIFMTVALLVAAILTACAPETIVETVIVEKEGEKIVETVEVEVEKEVEVVKEVEVIKEVEVEVPTKTLVFSSRLFSPPREQEFFINEVIKPFEEEHGVTVNFQIIDDVTLLARAEVQQTTNHITTDIIVSHNGSMPQWLDNGWVEDLTDVVASWDDRHFSPAFEQDTNRDGKQYFLPVGADVYLLLANNKALPYLPDGVELDTITWEQYAQWAVAVAEGEGEGKVCITGIPSKSWVYMFGGTALSYGAGFPDASSEGAAAAWDVWETIGKAGGFVPTVLNVDSCVDPMMREESWLTVFHNARAGQVFASNETQFTLAPAPTGPVGTGSIAGVSGYGIMKGSANYDLALMFLEYLTRPDIQVKIAKGTGGFIPPVQEAMDFLGNEAIDEVINKAVLVLEKGVVSGVPGSDYQDWGAVKACFDDVFEDTILVGADVTQDRLDEAQTCIDDLLK